MKKRGRIYLTAAFGLAGTSVIAAEYLGGSLEPFTTTAMSLLSALLTAWLLWFGEMKTGVTHISRKQWLLFSLQALFGSFLYRVFLTYGLKGVSAAEAGIMIGTTPAITAFLSRVVLKERFTVKKLFSILLTVAGIRALQEGGMDSGSLPHFIAKGSVLVLLAATSESVFNILARRVNNKKEENDYPVRPVIQAGIVSSLAFLFCLGPMISERPWRGLISLSMAGWIALLWYGSVVTIAAFTCFYKGARLCSGYEIAVFSGLAPVSSLILSMGLLGEQISSGQWIGGALIILAVLPVPAVPAGGQNFDRFRNQ